MAMRLIRLLCLLSTISTGSAEVLAMGHGGFDRNTRSSIELACVIEKGSGPVAYKRCIDKHVQDVLKFGAVPDLSNIDRTTRSSIELACVIEKGSGPVAYKRCIDNQLKSVASSGAVTDLSNFDRVTRSSIELACVVEKGSGPAAYKRCIDKHVQDVVRAGPVPNMSSLDRQTRSSIELACVVEKGSGPVAYSDCLRRHLNSLGIAPDRNVPQPRVTPKVVSPPKRGIANTAPKPKAPQAKVLSSWKGGIAPSNSDAKQKRLTPNDLFKSASQSVYVVLAFADQTALENIQPLAQGSAVAIDDFHLLTNCHVLEGGGVFVIGKSESKTLNTATITQADYSGDRCIVRSNNAVTPVQGIRRFESLEVGEGVFAIGSPSGLENTLSEGLISGKRNHNDLGLVQTSASISPGSSGGGLFDSRGNLVGITTMYLRDAQNLNFAISADEFLRR